LYRFQNIVAYFPKIKEVTWQWPRTLQGQFVVRRLGLAMINMHTKFEVSSLSRSRDISEELKIQRGSRDVSTPISGTFCHL